MMLDWARQLLAPGGSADIRVWEKILTDVADKVIKADLAMTALGSFKFVYFENNNYEDSIGFEVDDGKGFIKVYGIYQEIDGQTVKDNGPKKADGSQPVVIKRRLWGLTKRGWVLIEVNFEAVQEEDEFYYVKPLSHTGRYLDIKELFRWESPKVIAQVLDRQIEAWSKKYDELAKAAATLREDTGETLGFARSVNVRRGRHRSPSVI